MSDASGSVTLSRSYTPWGELLNQQSSGNMMWGYYMTSGWAAFDDVSLSPVLTDAGLATTTIRHTYDPLQRLTTATYSGATTYTFAYAYDAVGNRTAQTQTITSTLVTTYTYDAANRLTNVNTLAGTGGQAYTWDNNGNLTNDGSKVYTYTQANRLAAVSGTGLSWSAAYNGDGARLKQVANGSVTTYTLDLAAPLVTALTERTGATTKQYLYGLGDSPLAVYSGTTWTYLSGRDGLNSVRQETDASGNVITERRFDPYGVPLNGNGGAPFGYTGEMYDASPQLVFLRARYMQPTLGVFLSRDPWSGYELRPGSMNGWNYVEDNPVNHKDPSGLITEAEVLDAERLLTDLRNTYNVLIDKDWGKMPVWNCECDAWYGGKWRSLRELELTRDAIELTSAVMGPGRFTSAMRRSVTITRWGPIIRSCAPPGVLSVLGDIVLTNYNFDNQREYGIYGVVHEIGHVWDWRTGERLSRGMVSALGTERCELSPSTGYPMCRWDITYQLEPPPGRPGDPYAGTSRYEDWAEAFATYVYPDYYRLLGYNLLGPMRRQYVTDQINAIQ